MSMKELISIAALAGSYLIEHYTVHRVLFTFLVNEILMIRIFTELHKNFLVSRVFRLLRASLSDLG